MRPAFRIRRGDADLTPLLERRLVSLRVADVSGVEADRLTVTLADPDRIIALPPRGAELTVALGFDGDLVEVGRFVVDALAASGPPDRIAIGARSADLTAGLKAPKSRLWEDETVASLVAQIAEEHGLEARVAPLYADVAIDRLSQTSESDLNLLTRVARDLDAVAKVGGGALLIVVRGSGLSASGRPIDPVPIVRSQAVRWDWRLEDRGAYASASALWQDVEGGERRRVETSAAAPQFEVSRTFPSRSIALRAAEARLAELRRGALRLDVDLARGRPEILAETPIDLAGFRAEIDGRWIAESVTHQLDAAGLVTILRLAPPPEAAP